VPSLEVADIFRAHGPMWRQLERGHLSLGQLKVMSAIEQCRSAALGGHALRCSGCLQPQIAYNSCRNRHCPKCQGGAAQRWLDARQSDLLPVEYYHVVFTLPAPLSALAYSNKELMYGLLFDIAAETLRTIAADPKHLGARIGVTPGPAHLGFSPHSPLWTPRQRPPQTPHRNGSPTPASARADDHHRDLRTYSTHPRAAGAAQLMIIRRTTPGPSASALHGWPPTRPTVVSCATNAHPSAPQSPELTPHRAEMPYHSVADPCCGPTIDPAPPPASVQIPIALRCR
jgi:hypothetical protein